MKPVKISVIVPVYNREKYIGRAIRSLLDQTINPTTFEIIVIDDGSTDHSVEALKAFGNQIKLIKHDVNKGLPGALNSGIQNATGKYIIRVDSDDYVHSEYLNILSLYLEMNKNIDAVSCDYFEVDEKEEISVRRNAEEFPIGCGIMFRLENLIDVGLYDEGFLQHEEKDLMFRFEKKFTITRVALPLYRYWKHEENLTNDKASGEHFMKKLGEKHK